MKKVLFIINPKAGKGKGNSLEQLIFANINPYEFEVEISRTREAGHATHLARSAAQEEVDIVVSCGGDGTLNETATGLVGSQTALSLLPLGSGNGLARHLGIPMGVEKALQHFNHGQLQPLDCIRLNDYFVFNVAGIGFDAQVAHAFAKLTGRGFGNYVKAVFKEYGQSSEAAFIYDKGNGKQTEKAWLLSICNSNQFGNNFRIAPKASVSDGLMDVSFLRKIPMYQFPLQAHRLYRGSIGKSPYYKSFQTEKLEIYLDKPTPAHVDGEPIMLEGKLELSMGEQLKVWC